MELAEFLEKYFHTLYRKPTLEEDERRYLEDGGAAKLEAAFNSFVGELKSGFSVELQGDLADVVEDGQQDLFEKMVLHMGPLFVWTRFENGKLHLSFTPKES